MGFPESRERALRYRDGTVRVSVTGDHWGSLWLHYFRYRQDLYHLVVATLDYTQMILKIEARNNRGDIENILLDALDTIAYFRRQRLSMPKVLYRRRHLSMPKVLKTVPKHTLSIYDCLLMDIERSDRVSIKENMDLETKVVLHDHPLWNAHNIRATRAMQWNTAVVSFTYMLLTVFLCEPLTGVIDSVTFPLADVLAYYREQ